MNKRKNKIYIIVCLMITLLSIGLFYKDNSTTVNDVSATITPTVTPAPTVTYTPVPTSTPVPTNTPTPTPSVTPLPDISITVIKDALVAVEERLEICSTNKTTLYDVYSEEELELLFRVVEAEATDYGIECKSHVASVIFNRVNSGWKDGDLTKNLMSKRQFAVITNGRYLKVEITEETILACEIAFENDTAQGAFYFDSTKGKSWAHENKEFIFADDAHWFYR